MSVCQNCLQRMCRKHPLFDHGARTALIKSKVVESSQNLRDLVQATLKRAEADAKGTSEQELDDYKLEMDRLRNKAEKDSKKRKLNTDSSKFAGLNPSVARLMAGNSSDESGSEDNDSQSSSESEHEKKKKSKDKKDKKDKKEKKHKKSKKEKKDKKDKK